MKLSKPTEKWKPVVEKDKFAEILSLDNNNSSDYRNNAGKVSETSAPAYCNPGFTIQTIVNVTTSDTQL